ncbi:unnamed protein product, partial [Symbiodinium necroappetens]
APDSVTLGAGIAACDRGQQWQLAICFLHELSVPPTLIAVNSALSACSRGHQWQGAFQLFQLLQSRSLQPDEISFGAASTACIRGREWAKALGLLASVWRQKPPSLLLFTSALRAA